MDGKKMNSLKAEPHSLDGQERDSKYYIDNQQKLYKSQRKCNICH